MFEAFSFFAGIGFFLLAIALVSAAVAFLFGYYALAVAERLSGRALVSGRPRIVFSFLLGLPIAYLFVLIKQYGSFAFLLSFSVFLAVGAYSFLRVRRGELPEKKGRLRKYEIADLDEEKPIRKFRIKEKQKLPLRLFELDGGPGKGERGPKQPEPGKGERGYKNAGPEKEGGLFGFLESIPNPLKRESSLELAAKEFVLTRFGEKGAVERTWERGGKNFALVSSSGGRYTLTLNSRNTVVDWDKD